MTHTHGLRLLLLITLIFFGARFAAAQDARLQSLDDYVNKAMKEWEVPGVAIAIVKDDRIVLAKGYGVRKLGDPTPVNEQTIFAIGSASKAFTAAALAILVDEGKIKWDDPVTKHLPGFQLYDPYVTREMTLRDLLCHRLGLERGDLLWYGSNYTREEILHRARYLKPSWSLRSRFGYQNILYLAAGQTVQQVTGKSWDDFVRERIFAPLGMKTSSTSTRELTKFDNVATPHAKIEGRVQIVPWRNVDNIAPAGSINSNVVEVAQWVRLQLNEGKYADKQLLSSGAIKEMHKPHTIIPPEPPWSLLFPEARFLTYGLGWFVHDFRGRKVVEHGGDIDGMSALVAMMPEERLGIVILTNLSSSELRSALRYWIFDAYLQAPPRDWSAEFLKAMKGFLEQGKAAEKKAEAERVKGTSPSLALGKYAGTYQNDFYGEVKITLENNKLVAHYGPAFVGELEHWHYDTFQAKWRDQLLGKSFITFTLGASGKVEEVKVQNLAEFKRAPEKPQTVASITLGEAELQKFVGKYALSAPPLEIRIELVGGKLKAIVPGQPVATLVPVAPTRFSVEGAPVSIFIQFDVVDGQVRSLSLEQEQAPRLILQPKP